MFRKTAFAIPALMIGMVVGCMLSGITLSRFAYAKESERLLVQGNGRAVSSLRPPGEQFTLSASNAGSFKVIPAGKKFILTDILYIAQGSVRQGITVNIATANPINQTNDILFQVRVSPGESEDVHLCSGYVIPSGQTLVAFTNAGIEPGQFVSVSVTGYLADE